MRQRTRDQFPVSLLRPLQGKANAETSHLPGHTRPLWLLFTLGGMALLLVLLLISWLSTDSSTALMTQAEVAARAGDWNTALRYWRTINATAAARSSSHLGKRGLAWHLAVRLKPSIASGELSAVIHLTLSPGSSSSKFCSLRIELLRLNIWAGKPTVT